MEKYGGFLKKDIDFLKKIAERVKLALKCDWKSKTSQKVQNLVSINKINGFFEKTVDFFKKRQR